MDLKVLAARTPGFVGADLANLINKGALLAARKNKAQVEMADLEEAMVPDSQRHHRARGEIPRFFIPASSEDRMALRTVKAVVLLALAAAGTLAIGLPGAGGQTFLGIGQTAPEITGGPWINSQALSLSDLRQRVVLVEFWTYG